MDFKFIFSKTELFYAHLIYRCIPGAVKAVFNKLLEHLEDAYDFACLFPVILINRGVEFSDSDSLKTASNRITRTSIYYFDPMSINQKGGIENVHTMLHMRLPKETVFNDLTQ